MSYRDEDTKSLLIEFCDWFEAKRGVGDVNRKPNKSDVALFIEEREAGRAFRQRPDGTYGGSPQGEWGSWKIEKQY